jgi:hypothetical protein
VAVTADNCGAGQGEALFGANNVNNALAFVAFMEIFDAEILGILGERFNLNAAFFLGNAFAAVGGGHVVIDDSQRALRVAYRAARQAQALKGLGGGYFMDQMAVDIEQAGAILCLMNQMIVPDLVVKCAWLGHEKSQNEGCGCYLVLVTPMSNARSCMGLCGCCGVGRTADLINLLLSAGLKRALRSDSSHWPWKLPLFRLEALGL